MKAVGLAALVILGGGLWLAAAFMTFRGLGDLHAIAEHMRACR